MQIKIYKDLKKFTLTSTLTKADFDLAKKYRPAALKKQNAEGDDIFAISYVEGKPCISANGITFGATSNEGGFVMVSGDLPETVEASKYGEYVADLVGAALPFVNELETSVPMVVSNIRVERAALLNGIVEA